MRFHRTLPLQIITFVICFIMMALQMAVTGKTVPEEHTMFIVMIVFSVIIWIVGVVLSIVLDNTVGFGLVALSEFLVIVGCAFPNATLGSLTEILIIYIPLLLVPVSLIAVRGGVNFKRVMLVSIGILYIIVSFYSLVNVIQIASETTSGVYYGTVGTLSKRSSDAYALPIASSIFSLLYYILMVVSAFALFRNDQFVDD